MTVEIKEISPPRKLSGLSSFLVSFDYNEELISIIKSMTVAYWHKDIKAWELPACDLARLLDSMTTKCDIKLSLLDDNNSSDIVLTKLTDDEIASFRSKPFSHQVDTVNFGLSKSKWLNLSSMGCGKTFETIMYAEALKKRGLIDHCLVVCGVDSLRQNWKREIQSFSNESVVILGEHITKKGNVIYASIADRTKQIKNHIDEFFVIVNAATLRDPKFIDAVKKSDNKFGLIAVDEIHKFSSKQSLQCNGLMKLTSPFMVGLTGTPLINSPESCYIPLNWIGRDKSTLTNFRSEYMVYDESSAYNFALKRSIPIKTVVGYKNLDMLQEELKDCAIRVTLSDIRDDMPAKTVDTEVIEMSDKQMKFYTDIKNGVKEEADKIDLKSGNLLALVTRLRQATVAPGILTTNDIPSIKVDRTVEILTDLLQQGEKAVVMSAYREPLFKIQSELIKLKLSCTVNTGDTQEDIFNKNIKEFQNSKTPSAFLGTYSKCGTGITLNAASYMICLDEMWTDASNSQAHDRIWRVNNKRPAYIKILICKDTIDERVHEVASKKRNLSDYMIDGKEAPIEAQNMNDIYRDILTSL